MGNAEQFREMISSFAWQQALSSNCEAFEALLLFASRRVVQNRHLRKEKTCDSVIDEDGSSLTDGGQHDNELECYLWQTSLHAITLLTASTVRGSSLGLE